jgi:hypothetical protein
MAPRNSGLVLAALLTTLAGCPDKDDVTTGSTDATATTTDTSGTTAGDTTDATTQATTDDTTTPTTGADDGVWTCEDFAQKDVMCFGGDEAALIAECEEGFEYVEQVLGPECKMNYLAYAICIATSPCIPGDACAAEEAGLDCKPTAGPACAAQAEKLFMCGQTPSPAQTGSQCQLELNDYNHTNPPCGAAFEAFVACQATLACEDLPNNVGCEAEAIAYGDACPTDDF